MKIEIELGFSHIRDAISLIDEQISDRTKGDSRLQGLKHLRNAIIQAMPAGSVKLLARAGRKTDPA